MRARNLEQTSGGDRCGDRDKRLLVDELDKLQRCRVFEHRLIVRLRLAYDNVRGASNRIAELNRLFSGVYTSSGSAGTPSRAGGKRPETHREKSTTRVQPDQGGDEQGTRISTSIPLGLSRQRLTNGPFAIPIPSLSLTMAFFWPYAPT